ncbi:MAG: hypothetical protein HC929_18795 [Leptolyngbyaceae cyanobacterium SM2_5_2]|nr:hypothetical protein [Leptolyngbyaceae cyanobacterium SM2_5_2]
MTYSNERLDRIEALLEASAIQHNQEMARLGALAESNLAGLAEVRALAESNLAGLAEVRAIADSNARAVEAWSSRITDVETELNRQIETSIADTVQMVSDTAQMIADLGQQHQETDQRFEIFLQEMRADRQRFDQAMAANAAEHRAFTQNVQVLLAEIARLWQRVAG